MRLPRHLRRPKKDVSALGGVLAHLNFNQCSQVDNLNINLLQEYESLK